MQRLQHVGHTECVHLGYQLAVKRHAVPDHQLRQAALDTLCDLGRGGQRRYRLLRQGERALFPPYLVKPVLDRLLRGPQHRLARCAFETQPFDAYDAAACGVKQPEVHGDDLALGVLVAEATVAPHLRSGSAHYLEPIDPDWNVDTLRHALGPGRAEGLEHRIEENRMNAIVAALASQGLRQPDAGQALTVAAPKLLETSERGAEGKTFVGQSLVVLFYRHRLGALLAKCIQGDRLDFGRRTGHTTNRAGGMQRPGAVNLLGVRGQAEHLKSGRA